MNSSSYVTISLCIGGLPVTAFGFGEERRHTHTWKHTITKKICFFFFNQCIFILGDCARQKIYNISEKEKKQILHLGETFLCPLFVVFVLFALFSDVLVNVLFSVLICDYTTFLLRLCSLATTR